MPDNCIYVGRTTKWGNYSDVDAKAYPVKARGVFEAFLRDTVQGQALVKKAKIELKGKDLACWCREDAEFCHADVWLEIANED